MVASAAYVTGAAASAAVAVAAGLPVLGHGLRWEWLVSGVLTCAALLFTARGPLSRLSFRRAAVTVLVPGALLALFCVGTFTNPVVVDGKVQFEWSDSARNARFAEMALDDMRTIASYQDLSARPDMEILRRDLEDARSDAQQMRDSYQSLIETDGLPDPAFGPAARSLQAAAFETVQVMEKRIEVFDLGDDDASAGFQEQLAASQAAVAQLLTQAAGELRTAAKDTGIPLPNS